MTVADRWQCRGVGTALLHRLAAHVRTCGVEAFTAICLAENRDIQQLLLELGPHMRQTPRGDGVVEIEVELPTVEEERGLRAAAGGLLRLSSVEPPAKIDAHP